MGYYTYHRIRILNEYNTKENLEKLKEYIEKLSGYSFEISGSVIYGGSIKWYECRYQMEMISQFFPEYEIQVKGKGEDGVIWEIIYKDMKHYFKENPIFSDGESDSEEEEIYIEINKQKY